MGFVVGRASWSMYMIQDVFIIIIIFFTFGSFRCSWEVRSVRVALSVDSASSR